MAEHTIITVSPITAGEGALKIDGVKALKVVSAFASLALGAKGIPSFLSNIGEIANVVTRSFPNMQKAQSQGFAIFSGSLVQAIVDLLQEYTPSILSHSESFKSVSSLVLDALDKDEVHVGQRFFKVPGLNPSFIRVRENLATMLEKPALKLEAPIVQTVVSRLGSKFSDALFATVQSAQTNGVFKEFLAAIAPNPFLESAERAWLWDEYRAELNRQVYRRLFLHELEDHPEIALPDIYVPSRAVYRDSRDRIDQDIAAHRRVLHCVDLKAALMSEWLDRPTKSVGHSRLVTGDPGTGKSTFSLLFAKSLSESGWRVLFIPANSIRSLGLSLTKIIETHIQRTLRLDHQPSIEQELYDPDGTGRPLLIIIDGLDEYDVGGGTVSLAAARLVDHVMTVMDEWTIHGHEVRLLLCGRPEAASSLTRFRELGHHLHVTGFIEPKLDSDDFADKLSEDLFKIDQREEWWSKWQLLSGLADKGLPDVIKAGSLEVREITAQPLLNYMLAVLKLHHLEDFTNLSGLYGALFEKY